MSRKILLVLFSLLLAGLSALAQGQVVRGRVTDASGAPLPGASVIVKEAQGRGTVTGLDGEYSLAAAPSETLVFDFLGFIPVEEKVGDRTTLNVILREDARLLDEVVVVGYGTASKKLVSSSIASVKMEDVDRGADINPIKMLQGRVTGVSVISASGTPGADPNVIVRGVSSISGGSSPLYVVDGIPAEKYPAINPSDIERMEVLKDASATAIYGSRANSGVIIITTKSGKGGKTLIDVNSQIGVAQVAHDVLMANTEEYTRTIQQAIDNYNVQMLDVKSLYIPKEPADFDWVGAISRQWAVTSSNSVSLSGGTDKMNFYVSGGAETQEGYISNTSFNKFTGRAKFGYKVYPWLKFNLNSAIAYSRQNRAEETSTSLKVLRTAREEQPWFTPYQSDGSSYMVMTTTGLVRHNPVMLINEEKWWTDKFALSSTVSLDITPFKGLKYSPSVSGYAILDYSTKALSERHDARARNTGWGALTQQKDNSFRYVIDNILTYDGSLSKLTYNIMAGHSIEKYEYDQFGFMSSNYANEAFPSSSLGLVTSGAEIFKNDVNYSSYALESYFSRIAANWGDRYILNLSFRTDGSSRFPKENRYGFFPAASFAWIITNEKFMPKSALSELKIRLSAGQTGSMAGIGNWAAMSLISAGGSYNGSSAFTIGTPAQNLRWEKATKYDIGVDIGLWNDRLTANADVFYSRTDDMLYNKPVIASTGMTSLTSNIGRADNKGVEFALNSRILDGPVKWDLGFNVSWNDNRLVSLLDGTDRIIVPKSGSNLLGGEQHILQNDKPISSWYMYRFLGIYQNDSDVPAALYAKGVRAGDCIYDDIDGNGDIDEKDRDIVGKATPDFFGGITSNLSYKGFDLSVFCSYSAGNKVMAAWKGVDGVEGGEHLGLASGEVSIKGAGEVTQYFNITKQAANGYWRGPGTSNTIPRPLLAGAHSGYDYDYNVITSTRYLEDASYFRVKTVTLSYNLPERALKALRMEGFRCFVSIDNALTFTKYDGFDPEASYTSNPAAANYGVDFGLSPAMRTFLAGVSLKF